MSEYRLWIYAAFSNILASSRPGETRYGLHTFNIYGNRTCAFYVPYEIFNHMTSPNIIDTLHIFNLDKSTRGVMLSAMEPDSPSNHSATTVVCHCSCIEVTISLRSVKSLYGTGIVHYTNMWPPCYKNHEHRRTLRWTIGWYRKDTVIMCLISLYTEDADDLALFKYRKVSHVPCSLEWVPRYCS